MLESLEAPEYTARLYQRIHEATVIPAARVSIGDWTPTPNECHMNVTTWCENMEGYTVVRGWLYFDLANALPIVLFNAHSVVRAPDGKLWDITPNNASDSYPFLIAEETEDEYARFVMGGGARLRHTK